jgi:solute carrier family 45, member 1/2/4
MAASPYLVSLGLPKSLMASTFLVGPLSGFLVQPLVGGWADASQSRFGRRRPFMLAGTLICGFSMLLLGYGRALVTLFTTTGSLVSHNPLIIRKQRYNTA